MFVLQSILGHMSTKINIQQINIFNESYVEVLSLTN